MEVRRRGAWRRLGAGGSAGRYETTQSYHIRWNRDAEQPLTIRVTMEDALFFPGVEGYSADKPSLCEYTDGVLSGTFPLQMKWSERCYTVARPGQTLEKIALRLALADGSYARIRNREARQSLLRNLTAAIQKLNDESARIELGDGAKVQLPTQAELRKVIRRSSEDDVEASAD